MYRRSNYDPRYSSDDYWRGVRDTIDPMGIGMRLAMAQYNSMLNGAVGYLRSTCDGCGFEQCQCGGFIDGPCNRCNWSPCRCRPFETRRASSRHRCPSCESRKCFCDTPISLFKNYSYLQLINYLDLDSEQEDALRVICNAHLRAKKEQTTRSMEAITDSDSLFGTKAKNKVSDHYEAVDSTEIVSAVRDFGDLLSNGQKTRLEKIYK